ncbi:PAS domain-containing protein [Streptomyces mirabilis]|uniref:PAS domain-containing protein n=1 Tax=Streptomyces mirabilis TaxID=68239 RepID=UPI00369B78DE
MISTDKVIPGKQPNLREPSESAIAMLDELGTVVGWTRAAERLVGHSAGDVVGRSATVVLLYPEEAPTTAEFVEQCHAQHGWWGTTTLRHRDGHRLDVSLRVSMLWGQGESVRWLVSVTDIGEVSGEATNGLLRESLLARVPMGIVVGDPQLRCAWVNDTMESHDGISRDRRLGRRFTDVLPGVETEALASAMRQAVQGGPRSATTGRGCRRARIGSTRSQLRSSASRTPAAWCWGCASSVSTSPRAEGRAIAWPYSARAVSASAAAWT